MVQIIFGSFGETITNIRPEWTQIKEWLENGRVSEFRAITDMATGESGDHSCDVVVVGF